MCFVIILYNPSRVPGKHSSFCVTHKINHYYRLSGFKVTPNIGGKKEDYWKIHHIFVVKKLTFALTLAQDKFESRWEAWTEYVTPFGLDFK